MSWQKEIYGQDQYHTTHTLLAMYLVCATAQTLLLFSLLIQTYEKQRVIRLSALTFLWVRALDTSFRRRSPVVDPAERIRSPQLGG